MSITSPALGYCTNVHAGADWRHMRENLQRYAVAVKQLVSPARPMGVGLWFSAAAADELLRDRQLPEFAAWLEGQGLQAYTLNGFPFGDFHQRVVKHRVYEPAWWSPEREEYTRRLITILDGLLPAGCPGSISTLPIAWGSPLPDDALLQQAGRRLVRVAQHLADLRERTGRWITLCLEPEPGCVLDDRHDVVQWFQQRLLPQGDAQLIQDHLCVCHDVCHSVVMFEPQEDAWCCYRQAGIRVGKVQVSSAVVADFEGTDDPQQRQEMRRQLVGFNEPRYLHQTSVRKPSAEIRFYEDLSLALAQEDKAPDGQWRVHFHVPIYLERFGALHASQPEILASLALAQAQSVPHFEVETYAWSVLPPELQTPTLAEGIAREIAWCRRVAGWEDTGSPATPPAK